MKVNDIPEYLKGKNPAQIIAEVRKKFFSESEADDANDIHYDYAKKLETLLMISISDALCNCSKSMRVNELVAGMTDGPGDRAVEFLNMVLPME